ncbi:SMI1/KNR4 family protein [Clostridium estertheticum]|uniref:SMI1/KNR4 family protein n=1 Tax=Clostridium estertheticum TaxID=238834 RepID=UPI001CF2DD24|nr:SMI1/KNR4 family protein [Clostridium estertheticum]MCB2309450.1 SMI1/KNR4 family protein [Clostridium estertheticum]MCB2347889.1 SMI1/KNR4 family protein [Clostridium estertheticum]MCB2352402.1 SMI1/KNR4 family protein [Clostridium estertheticum]WAG45267.1 SMI1/KNR4 family protein [Clostridium estertheticum]
MHNFIKKIIDKYSITINDIRMVEKEFDIIFPEKLSNFFLEYNGAEIWLCDVNKNDNSYEIAELVPIKYGRLPVEKILKWDREDGIVEEGMIPIASDRGGNIYYLSVKSGNIVLYNEDDIEKPICISSNFDELLENLIIRK